MRLFLYCGEFIVRRGRVLVCSTLPREVHMRPLLLAAALLLTCSAASAFPTSIPKGTKVGDACTQPLKTLAPKLQTCPIAGPKKSRVWCPDGTAFELDDE